MLLSFLANTQGMTIHTIEKGGLQVVERKYDPLVFFLLPMQTPLQVHVLSARFVTATFLATHRLAYSFRMGLPLPLLLARSLNPEGCTPPTRRGSVRRFWASSVTFQHQRV